MNSNSGFFTRLKNSIMDFSAYRQFSTEPFGKAIKYLLLFALIFSLVGQFGFLYEYTTAINAIKPHINQTPDFALEGGKLKFDASLPYILDQDEYSVAVIVAPEDLDSWLNQWPTGIFITEDRMVFQTNGDIIEVTDFSIYNGIRITKATVLGIVNAAYFLLPLFIIGGYIWFFCAKLLGALFVAVFGIIFSNSLKLKLNFSAVYAMSIYALTLPAIAKVIYNYLPIDMNWLFNLVYYTIAVVYIYKAVEAIKSATPDLPEFPAEIE